MNKFYKRFLQLGIIIKSVYFYLYCKVFKPSKYDGFFIIAERGIDARDNGYTFYRYLRENKPEVNVKYVISSNSPDRAKIRTEDIIEYRSNEHYIAFFSAGYLISTHVMGFSPELGMYNKLDKKGVLKPVGKKVFLQHGITKDRITSLFNLNVDLFISGAKPEFDFINSNFNLKKGILKYTGFSRFDYLTPKDDKYILVMPTWRTWLYYCNEEKFVETDYFKCWNQFINNREILDKLKKHNYKLIFYPHHEIQKFIKCFKNNNKDIVIATIADYNVQSLLCNCSMLITDYSSVFFDVAYMNKPVIYYQFDRSEFFSKHYDPGYFNYIDNSFGDVLTNINALNEKIEFYFNNDMRIEEHYKKNIDSFFLYRDRKNSERIYNEIINL